MVIISFAAGLPDTNLAINRLLKNQEDIGNAIIQFYGVDAGNRLTALLKEHINGAASVLDAAKANDSARLDQASKGWYDNANAIADFLSGANPNFWKVDETRAMMKEHLDLTLEEASARLKGDFAGDIQAFDRVHLQVLMMADTLSKGIMAQFPKMFY